MHSADYQTDIMCSGGGMCALFFIMAAEFMALDAGAASVEECSAEETIQGVPFEIASLAGVPN